MPTFPAWDSTHCCCSPKIGFGAGIKITGLLSALALCSPVKLSATCNVRLFRPFMLSSYNLLQRPCSEISNPFQIFFSFLPFPGFPLDTPWAWLSLLQFTPPPLLGASPSLPAPGSSSHQTAKFGKCSQLSAALFSPRRLHSSLLFPSVSAVSNDFDCSSEE